MKSSAFILFISILLSSCAGLGVKGDTSLDRNGEAFTNLEKLKTQLKSEGRMDFELMEKTEQQLLKDGRLLGLGDYYFLQGTQHYLAMGAGGLDKANYEKAQKSLALSVQHYGYLNEDWLEAQSTWMLALTNMQANKPEETCDYYQKTLKLLKNSQGILKDFVYDVEKFDTPEEYVHGVLGDACAIYEAQKAVVKNSH